MNTDPLRMTHRLTKIRSELNPLTWKLNVKSNIISHCVENFKRIQILDNITPSDFRTSLNIEENLHNIFKSGQGAGKSGSFFFFSCDNNFIIKTMRGNEKPTVFKIIESMVQHFEATDNMSLLSRIYGMFTIKTNMF